MKKTEEKVIMYESDEAANIQTLTGWVSSKGRYWGKDEHMARFEGSTHQLCKCGEIKQTSRIHCDKCDAEIQHKRFLAYPFKEWDGETPLTLFDDDKFFWSEDDIEEYLEENELKPEDLQLLICHPNYLSEIDTEQWAEVLAEDQDPPKLILEKMKELNELIRKEKPISWSASNIRTEYKSDQSSNP